MESNNIFPIDHLIFNRFLAGEELMVLSTLACTLYPRVTIERK